MVSRVLPFHSIGGMQVIAWDLAKQFVARGVRVTCLTTSIEGRPKHFTEDGVNVVALDKTPSGIHSKAWWKYSKLYVQKNFLDDCDVLFSISAGGFSILDLKPEMKNTLFVFQAHGTSLSEIASKIKLRTLKSVLSIVKNFKWLPIDLIKYQKFDGIVAAGERVNRDFKSRFYRLFLKNKPVVYIPNGIDTSQFKPSIERKLIARKELGIGGNEFVILVASRLHKQKGIEQAVKAFEQYRQNGDGRLLIVGSGPDENNIKKIVHDLGIAQSVHFTGAVAMKDLPKFLNASDVYLFPTLHEEGLPLLPLEALASGIPVLASVHLKEINKCSSSVLSIEPRDIDTIIKGINEAKSITPNEISFLPEKYSIDGVVKQYLHFFESLTYDR